MNSPPVLQVEQLVKRYRDVTALAGVSLTIGAGEIFALLGPNGAGKTTLIGAVCGLVKKTSGTIRLFGVDLDQDPLRPRYDVGLVPQEVNFDPFFTVSESLRIQLGYYARPPDERRIHEVLEALSLSDKANSQTRALSGGMKRRLLIAKALVHRPKLVFLDEPTAGVDVELRRDLWDYVRQLRSEGTTVILTTHYLEEAEELADRVGIINSGRLLLVEDKVALLRRMGEKRVRITFSAAVGPLPPTLDGKAELAEDRRSLVVTERNGHPSAGEVLGQLYRGGFPVVEVDTRASRLEDVHIEPRRVPGADSVVVSEIYLSLQGESSHQGLLCSFVRLTGCHLRCRWCDSAFAFRGGTRMSVTEVVERVKALGSPRVEVTGGEPLLQPGVYPLMDSLLAAGLTVLLETSGAIDVRLVPAAVHKIVDVKCPGSGEVDRNDWRCLESLTGRDELKFVLASREDYEWAKRCIAGRGLERGPAGLLFSTVHGELSPTALAEWIIADRLPVRFQLQQHKVLWAPDARGV